MFTSRPLPDPICSRGGGAFHGRADQALAMWGTATPTAVSLGARLRALSADPVPWSQCSQDPPRCHVGIVDHVGWGVIILFPCAPQTEPGAEAWGQD